VTTPADMSDGPMVDRKQANGASTAAPWSPSAMIERLGGDEELARQLAELFVLECPRMMTEVRDSVAGGDADRVRRAAHAFKGSVGNFTDDAPTTTAFEMEVMGMDGRIEQMPALLARLESEVSGFLDALRRYEQGQP
jgi:HPt (histidine-containing phosphotransfer) domain-containing protein